MGFLIVDYFVVLTREQVAILILDNEQVEVKTLDGETIVISGSSTVRKIITSEKGAFNQLFHTDIFFKDHNKHLWGTLVISTKDKIVYYGTISPVFVT